MHSKTNKPENRIKKLDSWNLKLKDEKKNISLQRHMKQHNEGSGTMQCVKTEIQLDAAECYLNNMGGTRQLQAGQTSYIQVFF